MSLAYEPSKYTEPFNKVIALIGNPNTGKTTIFNALTGSRQHVGNWPGVTVEKKEGKLLSNNIPVVDLPGTYSLGAYSEDELVARNYILYDKPGVVIDVVDASNLKRNMYLAIQLLEMGSNLVLALNMMDEVQDNHMEINHEKLSKLLNIPVVPMTAAKKKGITELVSKACASFTNTKEPFTIDYGKEIEKEISALENVLKMHPSLSKKYPARWLAVKLLEEDSYLLEELESAHNAEKIKNALKTAQDNLKSVYSDDVETIIIEKRYGFIEGIMKNVVKKNKNIEETLSFSDKVDKIVLNRFLGIPIFLVAMWLTFQLTFPIGDIFIGYVETFFEWLGVLAVGTFGEGLLSSLIVDGILNGVGTVMAALPYILFLFFAISLLEDSGYMARAAYIMDRFMRSIGLQGKAFIPLLMGFGCSVPAVMATRTLEDKKDRMITMLVTPLMSCSARLPVYILFISVFFAEKRGLVLFSIYLLGIVLAIIMAKIFKKFLFPGEPTPFVMELPPYRIPTMKATLMHMWEKSSAFIRKAGTLITGAIILIWALSVFPAGVEYASQESLIGRFGSFIAPIFAPLGFGDWKAASSLVFGLLAKEVVVGTLGVLNGVGEEGLAAIIAQTWSPLAAYSYMVLVLTYVPCLAVLGAIKQETNSWKWVGFIVMYTLILGWITSFLVYQGGLLLGFN